MAPFYGQGSTASRPKSHQGDSLLFTTKFPKQIQKPPSNFEHRIFGLGILHLNHQAIVPYIYIHTTEKTTYTLEKQHQRHRLCVNLSTLSLIFILLLSHINYSIYKTIKYYFFYIYIYVCVCMCVYLYIVYMYVYMYVCVYNVCMYVYVYIYVCMYIYVYICMHMYIYVYIYIYMYIYMYMYVYVYVYIYICMCVYNVCMYICVYVYVCMYIYMYIYV